ncbi:MAG: hypothetical protein QXG86_04080 [Candidatus Woesearchaeota archaeon]
MVNRQKNIASNPRAKVVNDSNLSTPTPTTSTNYNCPKPIPNPDKACCFCQNGKVRVYASSNARKNNCMATPCATKYYGNAYGAESWGYCNDDGTNYEENCKPVITKGEETIPTPTPPTPEAEASSNKTCNSDNECQIGYKCIPIPSGYGVKYCASPTPTPPTLEAKRRTEAIEKKICIETNGVHFSGTDFKIKANSKLECDKLIGTINLNNDNTIRIFTYCIQTNDLCHYRCFYNNKRIDCWGIFEGAVQLGFNIGTQINYGPDDTLLYLINNLNKDIVIKSIVGFKKYLLPGAERFDYVNLNIYLSNRGFYVKEITGDAACGHVGGIKERIVIDTIIYCDANNENDCTTLSTPIEYDCESGGTSFLYILK